MPTSVSREREGVFVNTAQSSIKPDNRSLALKFASEAKAVADDILGVENVEYSKPREHIGRVKVYHYHDYGWGWGGFYSPRVYVIDGHSRRRDNDNGARVLLGLLAGVVGGFALYHLGSAIKHLREARQELKEIKPFTYWSVTQNDSSNQAFCTAIEKIAQIETRIFSRIESQAAWNLTEAGGIAAGSALTLVGAICAVQAYVAGGLLLGCAFGASKLLRWGLDSAEKDQCRDARQLRTALSELAVLEAS